MFTSSEWGSEKKHEEHHGNEDCNEVECPSFHSMKLFPVLSCLLLLLNHCHSLLNCFHSLPDIFQCLKHMLLKLFRLFDPISVIKEFLIQSIKNGTREALLKLGIVFHLKCRNLFSSKEIYYYSLSLAIN